MQHFVFPSYILLTCLYLAIVVFAPSLALSQVTGLQVQDFGFWMTGAQTEKVLACKFLPLFLVKDLCLLSQVDLAILVTFLLTSFYTCLGGIKAVIWTNVYQVH